LNFLRGEKDNPKINAILVIQGSLEDTDYAKYQKFIMNIEKEKVEKERVKL
jgi:hypothetical protein